VPLGLNLIGKMAAWCTVQCSALVSINEAALHRARLLHGWVTVYRQVKHLNHLG